MPSNMATTSSPSRMYVSPPYNVPPTSCILSRVSNWREQENLRCDNLPVVCGISLGSYKLGRASHPRPTMIHKHLTLGADVIIAVHDEP